LAISSSGTVLGSGGKENVELWDIPNGRRMGHVNAPGVAAMSFSNDDQWLSMVGKDGAARVWQAGASRFSVNVAGGCSLLAFSPAIATVAGVKDGRSVQLFHTTTGDTRGAFEMDSSIGLIRDLVFAPDTRHIAVADSQGTVRVIRLDYAP
jgi:WD40 repeat protein